MKYVNAQMKVDFYNASFGAKGELQQAWFRIWKITTDQRSIRTVAKVGDLVGKVLEIDEKTRFRHDYVRVRIACRDITKVSRSAESTLGIYLHDFIYEREVEVEGTDQNLNSGIMISDREQPPSAKKFKADDKNGKGSHAISSDKVSGKMVVQGSRTDGGKGQAPNLTMSAPSKLGGKNLYVSKQVT